MRIAFVTFEYPPFIVGGAGVYAKHVTEELSKLGHDVVVFTPNINQNNDAIDNIRIEKIRTDSWLLPKALQFWRKLPQTLNQINRENKFDIVHFNGLSYFFLKKRVLHCPHVLTVHHLVVDAIEQGDSNKLMRFFDLRGENSFFMPMIEKRAIKSVDRIIAVSNFTKNQIMKRYHLDKEKITVIYNGIDMNLSHFTEEDLKAVRNKYNLGDKPIILFVGRVDDPRKGLDILLKAFKQVLEQMDAVLLIVGRGDHDCPRKIAKFLGISQHIYFTGYVDLLTLKKIYTLCTVYVCPSKLEGFGLTIPEAMSAGKPIVASDVGAIPEIMQNNVNGILVQSGDSKSMADAIIKYLQDKKYSEMIGKKNETYIKDAFSWKKHAYQLESIYSKFMGN